MTDNKELKVLSIAEQEELGQAVKKMIQKAPFYRGENIQLFELETGNLGIFPTSGSVYLDQFLDGSFVGRYAFYLRYRILPGSDADKVGAQVYLGKMAEWLEGNKVPYEGKVYQLQTPDLTQGRDIQSVKRASVVGVSAVFQDGSMDFQVLINIDYYNEN